MWVPQQLLELFSIGKDTVTELRQEVAVLRADRDSLRDQLRRQQILSDWIRIRVNGLEAERVQLIEKAYGIQIPTPEILKTATAYTPDESISQLGFDHVDDEMAKKLGISHLLA